MKNKWLFIVITILSFIFIVVDKFIIKSEYGWLEIILFVICIILLIFSIIKLFQLSKFSKSVKIILEIVTILIVIWFSLLSIDYKRHINLYSPLFSIGYKVVEDYDMNIENGRVNTIKSTFYLFGIKINEVYVVVDYY